MLLARMLGLGIVLPALVAFGVGFALARVSRSWPVAGAGGAPILARSGPATAVALGYLVAHLGLHGFVGWLPTDVMQRLPLVALAVAAASWIDSPEASVAWRVVLDSLVAGAAALLLLTPVWETIGALGFLVAMFALVAVTVAVSRSLHVLLDQPRPVLIPLGLSLLAGSVALLCAATKTAMVAQLAGAVAAATAALAALGLLVGAKSSSFHGSAARVIAVLLTSCLALAQFYAEMRAEVAFAAALALSAPGAFSWAIRQRPRLGASLGWTASILALAFAGWEATRAHPSAAGQSAGEYDYGYQ